MTGFALMAMLMIGVAMLFLLPPLLKARSLRPGTGSEPSTLAVYRHQLAELELDLRSGALSATQYEASKLELERRVLEELPAARPPLASAVRSAPSAAAAVALLVPLAAGLLYWHLGSPDAMEAGSRNGADPHAAVHAGGADALAVVTERLASRLQAAPDDGAGWALLARSYAVLGRRSEALAAFRRAAELAPADAQLLADFADAAAMAQGGRLSGEPHDLLERALIADPGNVKALALAGSEAFERRDYRNAVRHWEHGLAVAPADSEFAAMLAANLAEARSLAGMPAARAPVARAESVSGRVTLAAGLASKAAPDDIVLLFARAAEGPRVPLALVKARVKDLPLTFRLDDSAAMVPAMKLSSVERVTVVARVSRSGTAQAQPGDLQGVAGPVAVGAADLRVEIDQTLR